MGDVIVG